jgi:predicted glycogen debranching enzyme
MSARGEPLPLRVEPDLLHDPDRALAREWLVSNGLGGYAGASLLGANTRRYHGLLVAALQPPVQRMVMLAGLLEEVTLPSGSYALSTHEFWDGTLSPQGFRYLQGVVWEGTIPVFIYELPGVHIERRIWMQPERNATVITYTLSGEVATAELAVAPLCTTRDFHAHTHGDASWRPKIGPLEDGLRVRMRAGLPALRLRGFPRPQGEASGEWWWRFLHRVERERGMDAEEDLYRAGRLRFQLTAGQPVALLATVEETDPLDWAGSSARALVVGREAGVRARARRAAVGDSPLALRLSLAADQFLVVRAPEGTTVVAGYHWFADWGRDTMISLPGLCLVTGRGDIARRILRTFASHLDQGMIPNRFPDDGSPPEYQTVDATLWFVLATHAYGQATDDWGLIDELLPGFEEVVRWHVQGTRHGIQVDPADGLLRAGEAGRALTWMDARTDGVPVTPRIGKPVEVNALWYNALCVLAEWQRRRGKPIEPYASMARQAQASFERRFWFEKGGYCFDMVDGEGGDDPALRPNQLLAVSLPYPLLGDLRARALLARVTQQLLTPVGLRTLSPQDARYVGTYRGDRGTRDRAYHQGTVWPWLLGPYWETHLRLHGRVEELESALGVLEGRLSGAAIGTLGEIFEGDAPHRPVGCVAQAWSVAEALRLLALARAARGGHRK